MAWISNLKHKIEEKSTKSSWFSSKVVGLGLVDLWEFPTLHSILQYGYLSWKMIKGFKENVGKKWLDTIKKTFAMTSHDITMTS